MRRWFSFGALLLMAGIVAAVAASYQEQWVKERVYWLIDVRGYVLRVRLETSSRIAELSQHEAD